MDKKDNNRFCFYDILVFAIALFLWPALIEAIKFCAHYYTNAYFVIFAR